MYKSLFICVVFAIASSQSAFGQTQSNQYLVGPNSNHSARIIQQQRAAQGIPATNAAYGDPVPAAANVSQGCDTGGVYRSIGSGCDANVATGCSPNVGCDTRPAMGNRFSGGCDAAPTAGCDTGCATGCNTGCGPKGCGIGKNFFSLGGNNCCVSEDYWKVYGGWNDLDGIGPRTVARDGYLFGGAIGKRCDNIRRELDFTHRDNSYDSGNITGSIRTTSGMANVLFDINVLQINDARSYVGAGAGLAYTELEVDGVGSTNDTAFAYQFIAGMEKQLRSGSKAFVEYRYFTTDDMNFGAGNITYDNRSVVFGLEFRK